MRDSRTRCSFVGILQELMGYSLACTVELKVSACVFSIEHGDEARLLLCPITFIPLFVLHIMQTEVCS